jgi:hypothetical protein
MPSPESFPFIPRSPELQPPTREQLRSSLIEEPYRATQRALDDYFEIALADFETASQSLDPAHADLVTYYHNSIVNASNRIHAEISAECERRLEDFDSKEADIPNEKLEEWFSGVVLRAEQDKSTYKEEARAIIGAANTMLASLKPRK